MQQLVSLTSKSNVRPVTKITTTQKETHCLRFFWGTDSEPGMVCGVRNQNKASCTNFKKVCFYGKSWKPLACCIMLNRTQMFCVTNGSFGCHAVPVTQIKRGTLCSEPVSLPSTHLQHQLVQSSIISNTNPFKESLYFSVKKVSIHKVALGTVY